MRNLLSGRGMGLDAVRECPRVMVVAHPDDETFWGGVTLASEPGWGVICVTHKSTVSRRRALRAATRCLGVPASILDVPDRKEHSPTPSAGTHLRDLLSALLNAPHVERVMTHGPDGEYGHPLHRFLSGAVTGMCDDRSRLWYFNFDEATDQAVLDPAAYARKQEAIECYLGPESTWSAPDRCHVELGRHEQPATATSYVRPWALIESTYASSGMNVS